jgi:Tetratricopeptide repeat
MVGIARVWVSFGPLSGEPAKARDLLAALLPDMERAVGPHHPDTLTTRANLAHWTGQAGEPAKARDLHAALLPDRERVLGPHHPDTLTTRRAIELWPGRAGRGGHR